LSHAELELLVAERTEALRKLSQRLLTVQDEERRKVARDLHDSTGQLLAAIKISVSLLEGKVGSNADASGLLKDISSLADQALQDIRTTSHLLHPPLLDEAGFASAAMWYVEGFAKRCGIEAALDFAPLHRNRPVPSSTGKSDERAPSLAEPKSHDPTAAHTG
jgi:signal transduction histidine kinase